MSDNYKEIPTNLITGFLGSGKTTVILELLKSKPDNNHWAVLVNEFGDVGIDGALLEQEGINSGAFIKEVPGGCICCAAGLPLQMALNLLIKQAKPQRILIEPTGVGHPRKVMDTLTGEFYKKVLDLRATICLVEPHKLKDQKYTSNETFIDQINIADVLLASKSDQASESDLTQFNTFSESFSIPKSHVETIQFGRIDISVLDLPRNPQRSVQFPDAHPEKSHTHEHHKGEDDSVIADISSAQNCDWRRFENNGQDYYGCGWIFNRIIFFDAVKLEALFIEERFSRIKGIFRTPEGWLVFNRSDKQFSRESSNYTDDSRVEFIEPEYHDWNEVEEQLINCIDHYESTE